ncbi:hypothetical protein NCC78_01190 [Micromonospora phytophila]|uniref:hypothetical protein n=1 Tax=Micromonospora phytophila TaxID=709888 RepID=UPI00202E7FE8|nr:hypothetical protein [Micromonospora phytophila]MCM0673347.1 hypothetical protein [Micromonospora phytophila]
MEAMHVMIRRYKMSGSMDDLMRKVDQQFAAQLSAGAPSDIGAPVEVPAGIVSYQAVRTGTDTLLTITVFDSEEYLERAQQGAAAIRRSLAEFNVEEIETFTGEVAIHRASEKLLPSVRPSA